MRKFLAHFFVLFLILIQFRTSSAQILPDPTAKIDAVIKEFSKRKLLSGNLLVARGNSQILRNINYANDELQMPNINQTRFFLGSVSKQYVATAIMRLVDLGRLRVNDPLNKIFPEYPKENLTGANGKEVLVHHLLNNTSGIPDAYADPKIASKVYKRPISFKEILNAIRFRPLKSPPGQVFEYSNTGFILLGEVVRRTSQMSFKGFMNKAFFVPLRMSNTTVGLPEASASLALCYEKIGRIREEFTSYYGIQEIHMQDHFTDGNIVSTVQELANWARLLATGHILSPESTKAMFRTSEPTDYTYGWFVHKNHFGQLLYEHPGEWLGYQSWVRYYPKLDLTIVWTSNQRMETDLLKFVDAISRAVLYAR